MLSNRQILVLKAIVEEYVSTNEPVGSRTLSKRNDLQVSPATLRNDMADLEDLGFIEKTHTSILFRFPAELISFIFKSRWYTVGMAASSYPVFDAESGCCAAGFER